jgi:hypothetical protein
MTSMNDLKLSKMSIDELKALHEMVTDVLQSKINNMVNDIKINDIVKINHSRVAGKKFYVTKINRKKMRVKEVGSGIIYNVSLSLISKI